MGFHSASFGIKVANHGDESQMVKLLYKKVTFFDVDGKECDYPSDISFNDRQTVSKVVCVPYDDYTDDGSPMEEVVCTNDDEWYEATGGLFFRPVWDGDLKLLSTYGCSYVIGYGSVGDDGEDMRIDISVDQLNAMMNLYQRLKTEGRLADESAFTLVGNCCS